MKKQEKNWNSGTITQFELSKLLYTSGFLTKINLTPTAKLVLMALIQHYNANNAEMFPSQKFLSLQLGISEKSVERAIANLSSENLISYVTQKVNKYRFTAHFFEQIKMSVNHRQNVGCNHRQNVGQTNNAEQINKKEKNIFCKGGASGFAAQTLETQAFLKDKVQSLNDANASVSQSETCNSNNLQENFGTKNLNHADFKNALQNFELFEKSYKTAENNTCGDFAQEENTQEETSVLDWSREDALQWVLKLSPLFRVRGLAKQLTEKFGYTQEELGLTA